MKLDFLLIKVFFTMFKNMYTMLPLLTHVLYVRICLSIGSFKVILTCCDSAYPFTAVVPYPVMYMYIYLPCVAVMLDRWSNSPVTVYRHARNSPLL